MDRRAWQVQSMGSQELDATERLSTCTIYHLEESANISGIRMINDLHGS